MAKDGIENLRTLSTDEARELGRKGGIARREKRDREKRDREKNVLKLQNQNT